MVEDASLKELREHAKLISPWYRDVRKKFDSVYTDFNALLVALEGGNPEEIKKRAAIYNKEIEGFEEALNFLGGLIKPMDI